MCRRHGGTLMTKPKKRKKTGDEPYLVYDNDGFLTDIKTDEEGFELP